jgi:hypothetical protein
VEIKEIMAGSPVWREEKNTEFSWGNHLEDRQVHDEIDQ